MLLVVATSGVNGGFLINLMIPVATINNLVYLMDGRGRWESHLTKKFLISD